MKISNSFTWMEILTVQKFPSCVKELMKGRKGRDCCETIITEFGSKAEELFKAKGYLLAPKVLWSETEG